MKISIISISVREIYWKVKQHNPAACDGANYNCDRCEQKSTQQNITKTHKHAVNELIKYNCDQCEYQVRNNIVLKPMNLQFMKELKTAVISANIRKLSQKSEAT